MLEHVHSVRGRLRIRTPLFRRNYAMAADARERFAGLDGITHVDVNTSTGSLVVCFDEERIGPTAIWRELVRHGYVQADDPALGLRATPTFQAEDAFVDMLSRAVVKLVAERSAAALVRAIL